MSPLTRRRKSDSRQNLEMAARVQSRWEELVEDYWSDEHGEGAIYEGLHCKVEPDLDTTATEAALDRLLEKGVVLDIPRDEGIGMKHLTTRWEKLGENATMSGSTKFASWDASTDGRSSGTIFFAPGASYCTRISHKRRVPTNTQDCTDAFHQAPEPDDVVVEPPEEYLNRSRAAGKSTHLNCKSKCCVVDKLVNVGLITSRLH